MIKWRAFLKRSTENASEKQSRSGLLTSDINRAMFNEISTIRQDPSILKCEEERFESKKLAFTVQKTELKFLEYKEKNSGRIYCSESTV
ncbi:hypothetical protein A3Q35_12290 [Aeribacillus pallidus]|nr:hypothetical protein A3Q35_12290 [Aeribacillus pallidus]